MTEVRHEVRIDRPVEEVFDFLAGGSDNPRWQPFVVTTTPPPGPIGVNSTFTQRARHPLGFTVSADYRITAFDRPRQLAIAVISGGPIRPAWTYDLEPTGDGATTVRCTIAIRPAGFARLATPALALLHPLLAWEASSLERARTLLEPD